MDSEVFDRIRDYLADQLDIETDKITPESDIINDFGADSLDVIDMITTLSDEFGVEIPDEEIENLIEERQAARKAKNFARADEIRNLLTEKGIILEDTREGVRWKRA